MKVFLIVGLLLVGTHGEKKINLEDIERDNLRSESSAKTQNTRGEEQKFLIKSEINQQHYQIPQEYSGSNGSPDLYATPPPIQQGPPETYAQPNKYDVKEPSFSQQNSVLPEQSPTPVYYTRYRQESLPEKGIPQNIYQPQQLFYQPEVTVGNQFQTVQQKSVSEKYAKNKEIVYVDIPMAQLLSYYPNLNANSGRSNGLLAHPQLHHLSAASTDHISIPVYTPALSQKPVVPLKPSYQVEYAQKYNTAVPATFTTKISKGASYTTPVTSKKFATSPLYVPSDQSYAQGKQFLYTQAYISSPQAQYVPRFVYSQPATVYMHTGPIYTDLYTRAHAYVQDNSLHGNGKQYNGPSEQLYTQPEVTEELPKEILRQEVSQSVSQNYVKVPEEPKGHFAPPQLPAQDFKSGITQLIAIPPHEDESLPQQNHVGLSEPRSLLDSYVPSKLIAAQDSARYRERPIQLEGGFLPSKENFLYKKRKSE